MMSVCAHKIYSDMYSDVRAVCFLMYNTHTKDEMRHAASQTVFDHSQFSGPAPRKPVRTACVRLRASRMPT